MNPSRLIKLMVILLVGMLPAAVMAVDAPQSLRLLGHSTLEPTSVMLDEADWRWLREQRTLIIGVSAPDYAPFDLSNNKQELEGITADYAALIGQALNIAVTVRRYDTRDEVIDALKSGAVDFLGSANGYEFADPQLVLSRSYANDQPVLVTRAGDNLALNADLAGRRVAMLYHYMPPDAVQAFYPQAQLQLFGSTFEAIGAVAFGQADVYLGDAISTRYLINKNHLNNVRMADFSAMEANPFGFALRKENTRLLRIINAALAAVPANQQMEILRRWSAGGIGFPEADRLRLSVNEQRWLEKHPRVKVAVVDKFVPLSFFNEKGEFEGLSAEVLSRISLRTGLKFDIEQGTSLPRLVDAVSTGRVDMLAAVTPSIERSEKIRFTRPYLSNPYALVVSADNERVITLEDMPGKRLAVVSGNSLAMQIAEDYPGVVFVEVENTEQAMALVAKGTVEATAVSLISARYMIARNYRERLRITSTVGREPARFTLGVNRSELELYSILDKALLSITPKRWTS